MDLLVTCHGWNPTTHALRTGGHLNSAQAEQQEVMIVGLGGGALPMHLRRALRLSVCVVELDPVVLQLAQQHFGLATDAGLKVRDPSCMRALN